MDERERFCEEWESWLEYEVQILQKKTRTAKKIQICDACQQLIYPGDTYEYLYYLQEGGRYDERTCEFCLEQAKILAEFKIYPPRPDINKAWVWAWKIKIP